MNESVNKTFHFILERGNPHLASHHVQLHQLTTGECVNEMNCKNLLEYFEHGEKSHTKFRNERFVVKAKSFSSVIYKSYIVIV